MGVLGLIGNPENRRMRQSVQVAADCGWTPRCWSYQTLMGEGAEGLTDCALIRIDSPGENADVARDLIALGGGPQDASLRHGEIAYQKEYHRGYCRVLERLDQTGAAFMNPPEHIRVMFDKWTCHQRFADTGLPRPQSFLAPSEVDDFFRITRLSPHGRLFLKPLHGSSASGVCAFRWSGDRQQLIAPIEIARDDDGDTVRFFNSLRVRRYANPEDIRLILEHLLPAGMIAEQWMRKATLDGEGFDMRIVVIGGEAQHVVIRQSRHPMTNLHLGNKRGDLGRFQEVFGDEVLFDCRRVAERALACFSGHLYAGVDVMLTPKAEPVLLEINAFGDLLPGVEHLGQSTYVSIFHAATHVYQHLL